MRKTRLAASCAMFATLLLSAHSSGLAASPHGEEHDAEMAMHHLHILLNEGISMVAEGSNLVMFAGTQATPDLDRPTLRHGQAMIADGRSLIGRALEGPEMSALAAGGKEPSAMLALTRELGASVVAIIEQLDRMPAVTGNHGTG